MITEYFSEEWFSLHGSLLPTNNGHNSSLTEEEFGILNDFIKQSLSPKVVSDRETDSTEKIL
jgi:hypothetical protein